MSEKSSWMEIAGSLENIMTERIAEMGMPEHVNADPLDLIQIMKTYGTSHSDECIADMAIFTRKVLKDECGVNIKLYEEEDSDEDVAPRDNAEALDIFKQWCNVNSYKFENASKDIKDEIVKEFEDGYVDSNIAREYFEAKDVLLYNDEDLIQHVEDLEGDDMVAFVEAMSVSDCFLALLIEELILSNL
jgi:hypothetical protein